MSFEFHWKSCINDAWSSNRTEKISWFKKEKHGKEILIFLGWWWKISIINSFVFCCQSLPRNLEFEIAFELVCSCVFFVRSLRRIMVGFWNNSTGHIYCWCVRQVRFLKRKKISVQCRIIDNLKTEWTKTQIFCRMEAYNYNFSFRVFQSELNSVLNDLVNIFPDYLSISIPGIKYEFYTSFVTQAFPDPHLI